MIETLAPFLSVQDRAKIPLLENQKSLPAPSQLQEEASFVLTTPEGSEVGIDLLEYLTPQELLESIIN